MSNPPDAGSIRPVSRLVSARVAPSLKVGLRPPRWKHAPGGFETGASVVEGGGGTGGAFPRMRAQIEPTRPAPGIRGMWNAGAEPDRAGMHVTKMDVPAFFAGIAIAAAGEGGHASIVPPI
jgi:hypothetical protein